MLLSAHQRQLRQAGWPAAQTLTDLADLTALWLEGTIPVQPGYDGGPDPETTDLVAALAHANRCGLLTHSSQPACSSLAYDGRPAAQRAGVSGYTDPDTARRLTRAGRRHGLITVMGAAPRWRTNYRTAVPVSWWGGRTSCAFGARLSRRAIAFCYAGCAAEAVRAVCDAVQITLVDPKWGRETSPLWQVLDSMRPAAGVPA